MNLANPHLWLWLLAIALMIAGLVGTILPALPGLLAIYGGVWLAAWIDDYTRIGGPTLLLLGVLTALGFAIDFFASVLGAKRVGASPQAIWGSFIGGILGIFLGIPGLIFGPFVGAVAGEWLARRHLPQAARVGMGTWLGLLIGTLAKVALAITMIGIFVLAWWL